MVSKVFRQPIVNQLNLKHPRHSEPHTPLMTRDRWYFRRTISAALLVIVLASPTQASEIAVPRFQLAQLATDDYFDRAYYYFEHGSLQSALSYYTRVLSLDPNYAEAYNNRGNTHADLGQYPEAIADFSEALNYDHPDLGLIYYNRGNTYLEMGRYDEAIADFSDAIQNSYSRIALAYYNRGNANLALRRYYSAIDDFELAISHDPSYIQAYNNRGSTQVYLENFTDAINDYSTAIELGQTEATPSETLGQAYYNRANIYYQLGEYHRAVTDYTAAITLSGSNRAADKAQSADVLYGRALAQMFLGDRTSALADLDQAIDLYNQAGNVEWYQNAQTLRDRWQ
jgi:tetratricopeptide (TPR) repeat protein